MYITNLSTIIDEEIVQATKQLNAFNRELRMLSTAPLALLSTEQLEGLEMRATQLTNASRYLAMETGRLVVLRKSLTSKNDFATFIGMTAEC